MTCYYIGLDLGQRQDFTALALVEQPIYVHPWMTQHPNWGWHIGLEKSGWVSPGDIYSGYVDAAQQSAMKHGYPADVPLNLRHLERFPLGTSYNKIVESVTDLMCKPPIAGRRTVLIVDATGVGGAVLDQFSTYRWLNPVAVNIHGGARVSTNKRLFGNRYLWDLGVPKRDLVSALQVATQRGRLKVPSALEYANTLREEMQNFRQKIDPKTAHDSYSHWRECEHDDLVLSVVLATWYRDYYNKRLDDEATHKVAVGGNVYG